MVDVPRDVMSGTPTIAAGPYSRLELRSGKFIILYLAGKSVGATTVLPHLVSL